MSGHPRLVPRQRRDGVDFAPAWHGFAMPATALLGWLLAGGLSAGVVLRAADLLGSPVPEGQGGGNALVVPTAYHWVAVAGLAAGTLALALAVVAYASEGLISSR